MKVETLVKQGWYFQYPSTNKLKRNEFFTCSLRKKLKHFANKRQVKHVSSSFEPLFSFFFYYLVNIIQSEDITLDKITQQELSLKIIALSDTFNQIATDTHSS